ncbi:MAG: acyloxyacyl hydrolase [Candidatus Paceibacterota bacterium]
MYKIIQSPNPLWLLLLLILYVFWMFFLVEQSKAQSISIAPTSIKAWGSVKRYGEASIKVKNIEIHIFHIYKRYYDNHNNPTYTNYALSYTPLSNKYIDIGVIYFTKPFPTIRGQRLNLKIVFKYNITKHIFIIYQHISNAYTNAHYNPGIDTLKLSYKLNLW